MLTLDALDLEANARRGAALYSEECAGCHGREAQGASQHDIPALASQRRAYIIRQLAKDRIEVKTMHKVVGDTVESDTTAILVRRPEIKK